MIALLLACTGAVEPKADDSGRDSATAVDGDTDTDSDTDTDTNTDTDTDTDADSDTDTPPLPVDADGDGYTSDVDCDDNDAAVNPGADDACWDGHDGNCDGVAAGCAFEGEIDVAAAGVKLIGELEMANAGAWIWGGDTDGDGIGDAVVYSHDDAGRGTDKLDVDLDLVPGTSSLSYADASVVGDYGDRFGSVVFPGDLDADGSTDVLIGTGSIYLLPVPSSGSVGVDTAVAEVTPSGDQSLANDSLLVGDFDGDGADDLMVDARLDEGDGACLFSGIPTGVADETSATGVIVGAPNIPNEVWAGDLDGDGTADVLIGSSVADDGGTDAGSVWYVSGFTAGTLDLADADARLDGEAGDGAGIDVDVTDLDADGYDDIAIGAYTSHAMSYEGGAVYVWSGTPSGTQALADAAGILAGPEQSGWAGDDLWAGDLDGDGGNELLVGAPMYRSDWSSPQAGVYRITTMPSGTVDLSTATARWTETAPDFTGGFVTVMDANLDGANDVLIGAPWEDTGGSNAGAAYIFYGPE